MTLQQMYKEAGINPLSSALYDLMDAATKSVHIALDKETLRTLKESGYKLCFAKKVGDNDYDVVWQSSDKYLENTTFSWMPAYQIFATNSFTESVKVKANTGFVSVGLNETVTMDQYGIMSDPVSGGSPTAITLVNNYGSIHPGISQLCRNDDNQLISAPIYVAQKSMLPGTVALTPVEKVLVWFEQNIETGTMFSTARTGAMEVDLTDKNDASLKYDPTNGWEIC